MRLDQKHFKICVLQITLYTLHTTPPHTPQLNPKAERAWLTIYNATRAMLHAMAAFNTAVPDTEPYWWYAAKHAVYLGNRSPSGTENTIPYEKFTGRLIERSFLEKLPPFGVNAYVHIPKQQRRLARLSSAKPGIFIGIHSPNSTDIKYSIQTQGQLWKQYMFDLKSR